MKELRTSKHGGIECFSYLKKHDMENYVKEEATDPKGDEVKAKQKMKRWTNPNNSCQEEERTFLQGIKGLQKKDISQLKCSVVMKDDNLRNNEEWKDDMIKKYQLIIHNDVWI